MEPRLHETAKKKEKAMVVGVATRGTSPQKAKLHLEELSRLVETAGADVVERVIQNRPSIDPGTLIGSGKLREIGIWVKENNIDLVAFDEDLSPSQAKKIEMELGVKVLDRSGIILDIFARNAQTAESRIQVEVAQLEYYLPRLTRAWTHLSRQVGGIGTRGPGETQLEVDRRLVRDRISFLKKKLKKNEGILIRQHKRRYPAMHVALVGYTNTGKSSLMNLLTNSEVLVENKLFATLDATTRKLPLGRRQGAVLSDTVGFIRKLPHHLVQSFKSTLSVVSEASLILHLVDGSDPDFQSHMEVTGQVLEELDTEHIPRITVFNKIDMLDPEHLKILKSNFPDAFFISVYEKEGIEALKAKIIDVFERHKVLHQKEVNRPASKGWSTA